MCFHVFSMKTAIVCSFLSFQPFFAPFRFTHPPWPRPCSAWLVPAWRAAVTGGPRWPGSGPEMWETLGTMQWLSWRTSDLWHFYKFQKWWFTWWFTVLNKFCFWWERVFWSTFEGSSHPSTSTTLCQWFDSWPVVRNWVGKKTCFSMWGPYPVSVSANYECCDCHFFVPTATALCLLLAA